MENLTAALHLPQAEFDRIVQHGLGGKPLEICGLLGGRRDGLSTTVDVTCPIDSLEPSELTYTMDMAQYVKAEKEFRRRGVEVVGIYHTHPATQPYPSPTDVAQAHWGDSDDLTFPGYSYLIVSLRDPDQPEPRSFKINGRRIPENIEEETVRIIPSNHSPAQPSGRAT